MRSNDCNALHVRNSSAESVSPAARSSSVSRHCWRSRGAGFSRRARSRAGTANSLHFSSSFIALSCSAASGLPRSAIRRSSTPGPGATTGLRRCLKNGTLSFGELTNAKMVRYAFAASSLAKSSQSFWRSFGESFVSFCAAGWAAGAVTTSPRATAKHRHGQDRFMVISNREGDVLEDRSRREGFEFGVPFQSRLRLLGRPGPRRSLREHVEQGICLRRPHVLDRLQCSPDAQLLRRERQSRRPFQQALDASEHLQ